MTNLKHLAHTTVLTTHTLMRRTGVLMYAFNPCLYVTAGSSVNTFSEPTELVGFLVFLVFWTYRNGKTRWFLWVAGHERLTHADHPNLKSNASICFSQSFRAGRVYGSGVTRASFNVMWYFCTRDDNQCKRTMNLCGKWTTIWTTTNTELREKQNSVLPLPALMQYVQLALWQILSLHADED